MNAIKLTEPVCQSTGTITISVEKYNSMHSSIDTLLRTYESSLKTIDILNKAIQSLKNPEPRALNTGKKVIKLWP